MVPPGATTLDPATVSGVTEIYICKAGQKLKEGRLELGHDITTKEQAETDARCRCKIDRAVERIAYYAVSESGNFRNVFTYTNPHATPARKPRTAAGPGPQKRARRKKAKNPTLWQRIRSFVDG